MKTPRYTRVNQIISPFSRKFLNELYTVQPNAVAFTESYEKTITDQLQITIMEKIVIVIWCTMIGFYTSPVKRIEQLPISTLSSRSDQKKNDNRSKHVIGRAVLHGKGNLNDERLYSLGKY